MNGSLQDLQVVECARLIPGPFCGKLLADLGAEVVKVEEPGRGDPARYLEPFLDDVPGPDRGGMFLYLNGNKRGITLDPASVTGGQVLRRLLRDADVLIEDFAAGQMAEWGMSFEMLHQDNPRLVVVSITPFGQSGPYRDFKTSDLITTQLGGLGFFTPATLADLRQPPLRPGGHQADFLSGLSAAILTLLAIFGRYAAGEGSHVDLSQHEAMALGLCRDFARYSFDDILPTRGQSTIAGVMGLLQCQDGWVHLQSRDPREWPQLVDMMDNPEWARDPLFADALTRDAHWNQLWAKIVEWAAQQGKNEVARRAQARHIACSPVNDAAELLAYPHLLARGFLVTTEQSGGEEIVLPGAPFRLEPGGWSVRRPAPRLGEHNEEILGGLGCPLEDLPRLSAARTI